ncbi:uncharacterized protein [Rutidosis leptorrhynchoides]|uniref:uncharacterized protein n=1 Tax=Rutidosis leptorrhynchoides TaxID=125765 RepID=UPI003A992976
MDLEPVLTWWLLKEFTHIIDQANLLSDVMACETSTNKLVLINVMIFIWRARRKRIPVLIELDKRGIYMGSTQSPVCDDYLESIDHVLFLCSFAKDIWVRIFNWWGAILPPNLSFERLLDGAGQTISSPMTKDRWKAVIWIACYYIWHHRNEVVFNNINKGAAVVSNEIQIKSYEWIYNRSNKSCFDWLPWLSSPQAIGGPNANRCGIG